MLKVVGFILYFVVFLLVVIGICVGGWLLKFFCVKLLFCFWFIEFVIVFNLFVVNCCCVCVGIGICECICSGKWCCVCIWFFCGVFVVCRCVFDVFDSLLVMVIGVFVEYCCVFL